MASIRQYGSGTAEKTTEGFWREYSRALINGEETRFTFEGKKRLEQKFENSLPVFRRNFYLNGRPQEETTFAYGEGDKGRTRTIIRKYFTDTGALNAEEITVNDLREGKTRRFHPDGKVASEQLYLGDKIISIKEYAPDGTLTCSHEFEADGSRKLDEPGAKGDCTAPARLIPIKSEN